MAFILLIFLRLFFLLITQGSQFTSHNITLGSSLNPYSNPAWLSPSGLFAFGFYVEDNGFRVGIWLKTKPEIIVVWTANRDDPLVSSNSSIKLLTNGWLLLHTNGEDKNITNQRVPATSASMLDSGNFLLYDDSGAAIWESFEHPCDTVLGGQELATYDQLVSSVSPSHHMSGNFVLNMQNNGNLVAYPLYAGSRLDDDSYWSTTSSDLGGYVSMYLNHTGSLNMVKDGVTQRVLNPVILSSGSRKRSNEIVIFRATLRWNGNFVLYSHRFISNSTRMIMKKEWEALHDPCEAKGICGSNSYCVSNGGNFSCHCFPGFLAFNETRNGNFYSCYRNFTDEEACNGKWEGLKLSYNITSLENIKLRDHYSYSVMNLSKEACRQSCLDDCNCWASLHANGFSCKMLKVPIIYAVRNKSILATVFIKTSFPYDPSEYPLRTETKKLVYILAITLGCLAFMCTMMAFFSFFFYRVHAHNSFQSISENTDLDVLRDQFRLRAFSYDDLHKATDGFKEMIGRNSYKGFISEGKKAVFVKRLERLFEGEGWFREEITAIAQTHHRNLVGLLGFCIQGSTKNDMEIDVLTSWVYNCFVNKDWNRLVEDDKVDVWMLEKMVKVGLLCIQNEPDARPSIKNVILMLEGTTDIPIPPSPTPPLI
ncbi:unnamed protein product [Lactuca virosa]|uniref:Bulb-type lectin domain-containing protein n=1 Tax=Lactuca virosa TaxID=75947 RepID=A0AAU9PUG2_9ASTR|nr:unnamed protein product [Lactuca virosa]